MTRAHLERLPLLLASSPFQSFTGDAMGGMLTGSARADTPFGPLAGRTPIHVDGFGEDSARISFMCGSTPVQLAVAGDNYYALVRALIANASAQRRQQLEEQLADAVGLVAS